MTQFAPRAFIVIILETLFIFPYLGIRIEVLVCSMEDIIDSVGRGETLNVTSDGCIGVERDSPSHLLNAYGSPINARGTEQNRTDEIYFSLHERITMRKKYRFRRLFSK